MVITVFASLHLGTLGSYSNDHSLQCGPTDTRIVPFSNAFCQNLSLSTDQRHFDYNSTLYILSSPPSLTGHESFSFSKHFFFYAYYYSYYRFYMHPRSYFTVSACYLVYRSDVNFYLIKGQTNFKKWEASAINPPKTKTQFKVENTCGETNMTHAYRINSSDDYFLVFFFNIQAEINISLTFYRTRYEFASDSVVESCSLLPSPNNSALSCSVVVPSSTRNTALLTVIPAPDTTIDWSSNVMITLSTNCSTQTWKHPIVSLACLIGLILFTTFLTMWIRECKRKNETSAHLSNVSMTAKLLDNSPISSE